MHLLSFLIILIYSLFTNPNIPYVSQRIKPSVLEGPKMINYNDFPNDSVLNCFINKEPPFNLGNVRVSKNKQLIGHHSSFTDLETINKTADSLLTHGITHFLKSIDYQVSFPETQTQRRNKIISNKNYSYLASTLSRELHTNEAEKGIDLYYFGRTIDELGKETIVRIVTLRTPKPQPSFPTDSIGVFDESISLKHVDDYIYSLNNYDTSNLASLITKPYKTELEKIRAIFMWLQKEIQYDYYGLANNRLTFEVSDVLSKRVAVCAGYANLFQHLCSKAGITSVYLSGMSPTGNHAWNAVRIDKKWYLIDATWGHKYFLMKPEIFVKEHYPLQFKKWTLLPELMTDQEWKKKYQSGVNPPKNPTE